MTFSPRAWLAMSLCAIVAGLALVLALGAPSQAATSDAHWNSPAQAMPSGADPVNDDPPYLATQNTGQVVSSPTGAVFVYYLTTDGTAMVAPFSGDGTLGTATAVPGASGVTSLGAVQFLSNGDAVFAWDTEYGTGLSYRLADGTWGGAPLLVPSGSGWGVRAGELLSVANSQGEVEASSYSIDATGDFSLDSTTPIFTGVAQGPVVVAMDPGDAAATVAMTIQTADDIVSVSRSATGTWSDTTDTLSGSGPATRLIGSSAPDGRALIAWTTPEGAGVQTVYWNVREPDGGFTHPGSQSYGTAQEANNAEFPQTAAGPDGTLALAVQNQVCPQNDDAIGSNLDAMALAPGTDTGMLSPVAGSAWTIDEDGGASATLDSVGAGDGEAIVGFEVNDSPQNVACDGSTEGEETDTETAEVSILGADGSPGTATLDEFTQADPVSYPGPGAAGLDIDGNAAVIGGFTAADPGYETYGTPGSAVSASQPPTTPSTTTTTTPVPPVSSTPSTPAATGTGAGATSTNPQPTGIASGGSATITTPDRPQPPVPGTTIAAGTVAPNHTTTVTVRNVNAYETQDVADMYADGGAGFVQAVARPARPVKPVLIAATKATVGAHATVKLRLKLSQAAVRVLKARHRLTATLKLTISAPGHGSIVVSRAVTLKR